MNDVSRPEYPQPLVAFCQGVVSKYVSQWPPEERQLADEFVAQFGLPALETFENQVKLCESLGIKVSEAILPANLRGCNSCYGNQIEIQIHNGKWSLITREHTLLHELREILEYIFQDLGHPIEKERSALEARAEKFATSIEIDTFTEQWKIIFHATEGIESKWKRWGALFLISVFGIAGLFSIPMLPVFEDQIFDKDLGNPRNIRT